MLVPGDRAELTPNVLGHAACVLPGLQRLMGVGVAVGAVDKHRGPVNVQRDVEGGPPQLKIRPPASRPG